MAQHFRSQQAQAIHYFSRPRQRVPDGPVTSPAAWKGDIAKQPDRWMFTLGDDEIEELRQSAFDIASQQTPLHLLKPTDFALPKLGTRLKYWANQVNRGLGFVLIRGLPVDDWPESVIRTCYWGMGLHLGIPGSQNPRGDLLGDVRDLQQPTAGRYYQTNKAIAFHCDAADVVGLLCLKPAKQGGLSRIASSISIFNRIAEQSPALIPDFFSRFPLDTHGESGIPFLLTRPAAFDGERLRVFYHSDYFRSGAAKESSPALSSTQYKLLEEIDRLAASPEFHIDMELRTGDIQLISNHTIIHARTGYIDHQQAVNRRHLLRLWLTNPLEYDGSFGRKLLASLAFQIDVAIQRLQYRR